MIHYDIDLALFGVAEARKNLIAKDPQAQFALSQFGDAVKLTELSARARGVRRAVAVSRAFGPTSWAYEIGLAQGIGAC